MIRVHLITVGLACGSVFLDFHAYEWYLPFLFHPSLCVVPQSQVKVLKEMGMKDLPTAQDTLQQTHHQPLWTTRLLLLK